MKCTTAAHLFVIGITGLLLTGCSRSAQDSSKSPRASSAMTTSAAQAPLVSNSQAFQAAATRCQKTTPRYSTALSSECAQVADAALALRRQYAAGIDLADTASMAIKALYTSSGKLPATNAGAGLSAPDALAAKNGAGKYVDSVTIGPTPGMITVIWAHGVLAGKKLVAVPMARSSAMPSLCWQVEDVGTTVPKITQQLGPSLTDQCN